MRIFVWFYGTWALFQDLSFFISWGFLLLGEIHRLCIGFISGALTQLLLIYLHRKYGWAKSPDVIAAYVFSIAMMVLTLLVSGPLPSLPGI